MVLIEGISKRSKDCLQGRNDNNVKVILPGMEAIPSKDGRVSKELKPGDYVAVQINAASSQVLKGKCFVLSLLFLRSVLLVRFVRRSSFIG